MLRPGVSEVVPKLGLGNNGLRGTNSAPSPSSVSGATVQLPSPGVVEGVSENLYTRQEQATLILFYFTKSFEWLGGQGGTWNRETKVGSVKTYTLSFCVQNLCVTC